ncbi:MAG: hypothetical protein K5905_06325 [Roseibium sp.]|uniref:hypothetical protein n=1 Tax=Roseibium sp. TaxID=1936156 RepID=UPI00262E8A1F|nr:hypothetical protein [Roseibium sp.]MCV0425067.1 hypothetical protein [Roseibium sp.]
MIDLATPLDDEPADLTPGEGGVSGFGTQCFKVVVVIEGNGAFDQPSSETQELNPFFSMDGGAGKRITDLPSPFMEPQPGAGERHL